MAANLARVLTGDTAVGLSSAYSEALQASSLGWAVFPCTADKLPDFRLLQDTTGSNSWAQFRDRRPTGQQLEAWEGAASFGVVNGPASGLLVLDVDPRNGGLDRRYRAKRPAGVAARMAGPQANNPKKAR